jgi:hypothetical protein
MDASENGSREDSGTEWKKFGGSAEDLGVKKEGTRLKEELKWHVYGHT